MQKPRPVFFYFFNDNVMRAIIILAVTATITLYSCQKKDSTPADPAAVNISISSPTATDVFHTGDSIHINADVSYATELHGYEVKITDTASNMVLYDETQHIHDDHFTIRDIWVNTASQKASLKLSLIVAVDHDGNNVEKDLYFQYQP